MAHRHSPTPMEFSVNALAVWRITRLITEDEITRRPRDWIVMNAPDKIAYLVTCKHCSSIYAGGAAVFLRTVAPRVWKPLAELLALSAVTSLTASVLETASPADEFGPPLG